MTATHHTTALLNRLTDLNAGDMLSAIDSEYGDEAVFSTSLGLEDQLIAHYIFTQKLRIRVFTLDTGRLFAETLNLLSRTIEHYDARIEVLFPRHEAVQTMMTEKGPNSFYLSVANRKECCGIRKVEPLRRALAGAKCWVTGLRADQSPERGHIPLVEWDEAYGLVKVHPLIGLTFDEVKAETTRLHIPVNPLHNRNFVSIGCAPCTRAIRPGESFRSGRWWWEDSGEKKECGLHTN